MTLHLWQIIAASSVSFIFGALVGYEISGHSKVDGVKSGNHTAEGDS